DAVKPGERRAPSGPRKEQNGNDSSKQVRPTEVVQVETPLSPSAKDVPTVRRGRDGPPAIG
ncbi:MAG: hypothetical protein WBN37_08180, partial [Arenicellales bacterium]